MRPGDLIRWAGTVPVPSGDGAGGSWSVPSWQRKLFGALIRPGVSVIAASCGRGNGKSAVAGLIGRMFLPGGPLYAEGAEVLVVSASHPQARLVVQDVAAWAEPDWRISDNHSYARVVAGGATVRAVAARPQSLHGIRPLLIVADELTQWQAPEKMYSALRTSLGKRYGARMLCVGTRPMSGSGHIFDRLLEGGPAGADVVLNYCASPADDQAGRLGYRRTWRKANPSLDVLPSLEEAIRAEWKEAKADPQAMARFRSLRLNMGVSDVHRDNVLIDPAAWERIEVDILPPRRGPLVIGFDVGGNLAFTAACAFWPKTRRLEALATCGGVPDLARRGRADQVGRLYVELARRGELIVQPGRRVPCYATFVREVLARWGVPDVIVADRWKESELRDALDEAGAPRGRSLVTRGQGWRDGAEDVRRARRMVLGGKIAAERSLLLRAAIGEARVVSDIAGNQKLSKDSEGGRRKRARDDVAAALILALAEAARRGIPDERPALRLVAV